MKKKYSTIVIICNGTLNDENFHKSLLGQADLVICADGGANNAGKLDVVPDYVIGDMDSAEKDILEKLSKKHNSKIIIDHNQDKTDTELAIELAESFNPKEIILLCAIGTRIDHTIANILCLDRIKKGINARIIDNKNEIILMDSSSLEFFGKKGDIISIIPLTDVKGLTYEGLKWGLDDKNVKFNWFGICNQLTSQKGSISVKKGKLVIIKAKD